MPSTERSSVARGRTHRLAHAIVVALFLGSTLVVLTAQAIRHTGRTGAPELSRASAEWQAIASKTATLHVTDQVLNSYLSVPRPLTAQQIARSQLSTDKLTPSWAARRAAAATANPSAGPMAGTEVVPESDSPASTSRAPFAVLRERTIPLDPVPYGLAVRMVAEPAIALGDSVIWVTGNWFAARSADGGATWRYVDPYADFPTFTSDQDAVFDPHRHLFLWYRQGGALAGGVENSFRLNVSGDGANSWCGYNLRPTELDASWTTFDFDYPHLALTDDYLYISTTLLVNGGGFTTPRMLLLRMPLDSLGACASFQFVYWMMNGGWSWTPVESGATTIMYLGDTLDAGGSGATGVFRLYLQPQFSTLLYFVDREVPAWTFTERTGLCPVLGGGNPCTRTDQRITSGWVRRVKNRGEVGFLWNVRDGGGFPYPYIDAVTFDEETLQVTGRPMLWDSGCAWQYGATAVNGQGQLGISAFYLCSTLPPAHTVGFADRANGRISGWRMFYTRIGGVPTSTQIWGDYIRVRAAGQGFAATGYTIETTGAAPFLVPFGWAALR